MCKKGFIAQISLCCTKSKAWGDFFTVFDIFCVVSPRIQNHHLFPRYQRVEGGKQNWIWDSHDVEHVLLEIQSYASDLAWNFCWKPPTPPPVWPSWGRSHGGGLVVVLRHGEPQSLPVLLAVRVPQGGVQSDEPAAPLLWGRRAVLVRGPVSVVHAACVVIDDVDPIKRGLARQAPLAL